MSSGAPGPRAPPERHATARASRPHEGTRVGLTVTRPVGRMMGDEVRVVSRGSTFTLRVPVSFAG